MTTHTLHPCGAVHFDVEPAWAAVLAVEDVLGGYGSYASLGMSRSRLVIPVSHTGCYQLGVEVQDAGALLTVLANGCEYPVRSWAVSDGRWELYVNDAGSALATDEMRVVIDTTVKDGMFVEVFCANLLVSHWNEADSFAKITWMEDPQAAQAG